MAGRNESIGRFPCQCCGFLTLSDPATGSYEICPVCYWEDDPVQNEDHLYASGANRVSLDAARQNYVRFGGCEPASIDKVRHPTIDEVPSPAVLGLDDSSRAASLRSGRAILLGIVRAMVAGSITVLEGCSAVAAIGWVLPSREIEDQLRFFIGVASEAENFPSTATRHMWSPDALAVQDQRAAEYSQRIESKVREACTLLENYLKLEIVD